ncbi:ethanolamine ammonia-lyase [Opitutaceae bacterium EW11]|nr:ethanolamine ammonia-lyase [Opitutaceae bacterium EW11]
MPSNDSRRPAPAGPDSWCSLSHYTSARIALGRSGGSLRTVSQLDFRLAHARARDAVNAAFDANGIIRQLRHDGLPTEWLTTAVPNRETYLLRPDLGRRLADVSRTWLRNAANAWGRRDLAILVSDGLAARAAENHAAATIVPLVRQLESEGWSIFPIFVVPLARVKLQDDVGEVVGARHTILFLGERPGLGSPDSLGAYFTYRPRQSCTDADRNCVSNIRAEGLPPIQAARKLALLLKKSARLELSGVRLKDDEPAEIESPASAPPMLVEG